MKILFLIIISIVVVSTLSVLIIFYPEYLGLYDNQNNGKRIIFVSKSLSYEEYPPQFLGSERKFNEIYSIVVELNSDELLKFPALVTAMNNIGKSDLNKIQGFTQMDDTQYQELKHLLMEKASLEKPNRVDNPTTRAFSYLDKEYHIKFKLFSKIWDYPAISINLYDIDKYPTLVKYSGFVTLTDKDLKKMPKLTESLFKNDKIPLWKIEQLAYQSYLDKKFVEKYSQSDILLSSNIIEYDDKFYTTQFLLDFREEDCTNQPCSTP